jgi:penicillin-binding protein 2
MINALTLRLAAPLTALALLAAACSNGGDNSSPGEQPTDPPENPREAGEQFLELWQSGRFDDMYDLLSSESRLDIDRETFVGRYEAITDEATITGFDYELLPGVSSDVEEVRYSITFRTTFFGDITETNAIPLVKEEIASEGTGTPAATKSEWRVQWTPSLYFKQLDDRSLVHFFKRVPSRGGIYDRNGSPLAYDAQLAVVGVVPDLVQDTEAVIARLSETLGVPADQVRAEVTADVPSYYFIPVKTLPHDTPEAEIEKFRELVDLGIVVRDEAQRLYPNGDSAAHVLGYMTEVTEEQLNELADKGFEPGDRIGAAGLELELDGVLAGERGGLLATVTPEGTISAQIAEKPAVAGQDVYLCLDINVQKKAEAELGQRVGSIVAMDPSDNCVLAIASYPRFDPNSFYRGLTQEEVDRYFNDPEQPFLNRALLAQYPPGSTFKVVTTAAGLERGGVSPTDRFHCTPVWDKLGDEFAQKNWQSVDRGWLTPSEGLMASCNPVFFDIAKILDETDSDILPQVAREMGFGSVTGIGLDEAPGIVPDPEWKGDNIGDFWYTGDAVNMSIGQGYVLATPIQIANMYSAIARTGVLREPLLIKAIGEEGLSVRQEFEAETINPLPASQSTLEAIRHGMYLVTQNPGGTSYRAWLGSSVDAAGKSGTAEDTAYGADHVFFVAYANRSDPSILAIAALEEGESGSFEAGPMVRHILESYIGGALVSNQ